eukprot:gene19220-25071_t
MLLDYSKKLDVMKKLCSRLGLDGDMVGSASSVDPIFWIYSIQPVVAPVVDMLRGERKIG